MNTARPFRLRALWLVVFGLAGSVCGSAAAAEAVVNTQVPEQQVSTGDLRAIFTLRKRAWRDGTPIKLFVLPDNNELHQKFAKQQLRLYPYQLRQIWDRAVFSGTGSAPTLVRDTEEMLKAVGETPGAIGYAESADLPAGVRPAAGAPP